MANPCNTTVTNVPIITLQYLYNYNVFILIGKILRIINSNFNVIVVSGNLVGLCIVSFCYISYVIKYCFPKMNKIKK